MNPKRMAYHRQVIGALLVLFIGVLFATVRQSAILATVNRPALSAELAAEQNTDAGQIKTINTSDSYLPPLPLDFTPVVTAYLPIIYKSPLPATSCNPTGGSGGLAPGRHETTVAGLNATVVVAEGYDPQTPTYLGFFVHGDYGSWTKFQTASNPVTQFVDQQGWIFVAPQSPNGGESWWTNWNGDHNEAFAGVLEEMFANYNVCRNIVFGSSGSGGSVFWTGQFFPEKGAVYPAHAVIGCGGSDGGAHKQQIIALGQDPDVVAKSSFVYVYGTEDSLYNYIQLSIATYTIAGFNVYVYELQGAGHCNEWTEQGLPNLSEQIATHWEERAKALNVYRDQ